MLMVDHDEPHYASGPSKCPACESRLDLTGSIEWSGDDGGVIPVRCSQSDDVCSWSGYLELRVVDVSWMVRGENEATAIGDVGEEGDAVSAVADLGKSVSYCNYRALVGDES